VIAGIRPEVLHLASDAPGGLPLEITAEVVEPLGSDVFVHGRLGDQAVIARLPGHASVTAGQQVALTVDPADLHLFDKQSGERVM
jgi:ABC-type sugar transport system ATPase subunit